MWLFPWRVRVVVGQSLLLHSRFDAYGTQSPKLVRSVFAIRSPVLSVSDGRDFLSKGIMRRCLGPLVHVTQSLTLRLVRGEPVICNLIYNNNITTFLSLDIERRVRLINIINNMFARECF